MQRFDLKKPKDVEVKEKYQVKIWNRFIALENLDTNVDMNRAWEYHGFSQRGPRSLRIKEP
jgi:hypothetical protein